MLKWIKVNMGLRSVNVDSVAMTRRRAGHTETLTTYPNLGSNTAHAIMQRSFNSFANSPCMGMWVVGGWVAG